MREELFFFFFLGTSTEGLGNFICKPLLGTVF